MEKSNRFSLLEYSSYSIPNHLRVRREVVRSLREKNKNHQRNSINSQTPIDNQSNYGYVLSSHCRQSIDRITCLEN